MSENTPWWGDFTFEDQQTRSWSIGERKLVIQRLSCEWNSWNISSDVETVDSIQIGDSITPEQLEGQPLDRHLQTATGDTLRVLPALADRSIVARPNVPLRLLGGEKARIYVSSPLWFRAITLPGKLDLIDVPFWRPSDSWFGPSTREGEMCYAKYTEARVQLDLLVQRPHRAITPVFIHNKQKLPLLIDRLNVPVQLLSLYQHEERGLWTEAVNVTREEDDDKVELVLKKQAPSEVLGAELVAAPRIANKGHTLIRSLSSLFA